MKQWLIEIEKEIITTKLEPSTLFVRAATRKLSSYKYEARRKEKGKYYLKEMK